MLHCHNKGSTPFSSSFALSMRKADATGGHSHLSHLPFVPDNASSKFSGSLFTRERRSFAVYSHKKSRWHLLRENVYRVKSCCSRMQNLLNDNFASEEIHMSEHFLFLSSLLRSSLTNNCYNKFYIFSGYLSRLESIKT